MTRLHFGFYFFVLYAGWVIYRVFIKKDIKQYKNDLYVFTFFIVVWALIYYWLFFKDVNHFFKML